MAEKHARRSLVNIHAHEIVQKAKIFQIEFLTESWDDVGESSRRSSQNDIVDLEQQISRDWGMLINKQEGIQFTAKKSKRTDMSGKLLKPSPESLV